METVKRANHKYFESILPTNALLLLSALLFSIKVNLLEINNRKLIMIKQLGEMSGVELNILLIHKLPHEHTNSN